MLYIALDSTNFSMTFPPSPLCYNDHSLGTEIQLTLFSIQLDCVLIIKLILVKSTVNPTREILKLEMRA